MEAVVLVIHLIFALAIIALVLLQRSEGGGLGLGGGGTMGGLTTARGAATALTKATAFCAAGFFTTSILLAMLAGTHSKAGASILDRFETPVPAIEDSATKEEVELEAPSAPEPDPNE